MLRIKIFTLFVIILLNLNVLIHCAIENNGKLIAASIIFRHGDRTPVEPYPNDPYKDQSLWPAHFGQLTNTGKRQHFELGKWFRARYNSLVSDKYNPDEMLVRSTDMDRTLMSAMSNLAGFYPPKDLDIWNEEIQWQPIPVHTTPEKLDEILAAKKSCPVYDYELKKLYKSPEFKAYDQKYKPIYKYLTQYAGKKVDSIQSVQNIYSCLHIEQIYNFTLPEWTKEVFPDKMFEISGLSFAVKTYTPLLARLKTGPLLKEILNLFQNKTEGKKTKNLYIYSAHDTTVANMLNTLGVFKLLGYHNPPYTSHILFELIEKNNDYFVQVFYRNTTGDPLLLNLPCGTLCPLNQMFKTYKDVLPINWEEECQLSLLQMPLDINVENSLSLMTIFSFIALMLFVGVIVLFIATVYKRRDYLSEDKWNRWGNEWN
ncbi:hypothetical protein PVAND_003780 [Polypedilum vanderplanki]|uniref:acid phosphatase n=1 Tax=Polypedilum vanderplanki TaxID=319348 RepID=A0A9J6BVL9_POLVA|nr:hypothetical protein PVAND_003780 [Polypedilum vanderplanki]